MKEFILAFLTVLFLSVAVYISFDDVRNTKCVKVGKDYSLMGQFKKIPVKCVNYIDVRYYEEQKNLLESKSGGHFLTL